MMKCSEEEIMQINESSNDEEQQKQGMISNRSKGGFITMPFILANEAFERVASFGMTPNMIVYLMNEYNLKVTKAQNLLYFYNSTNSFTPFVGAILADCFFGRFLTIVFGSIISFLGIFVMWLTAVFPQAKPPQCDASTTTCTTPTTGQYAFLLLGFVLMAIGGGGTRPCSQAFGADQVNLGYDINNKNNNNKKKNNLEIFLNWYYMLSSVSVIVALTVIVYIQDHLGWMVGFGVPVALMFLATISFFLASPFYVIVKSDKKLLSGLLQVIVAAFRNRNIKRTGLRARYYCGLGSSVSAPSQYLRFLDKACIIQDPEADVGSDGLARNPWRLCCVDNVEALKSFIRVIPIWSAGIMISVNTSAAAFNLLLIRTMDRHVGPNFEIPAASFGTLMVIVIVIWIAIYDRVLLPVASKIRGKPVTLSVNLRMGLGLFFWFMSVLTSGILESVRRQRAIEEGFEGDPSAVIQMSALWTLPQSIFGGIGEAFYAIAITEFFYTALPKNMLSIASSIFGLSGVFGSLVASGILSAIDGLTKSEGNQGWIADNVNKGRYDYYYYLVAALNLLNMGYYVYCSRAYGLTRTERFVREVLDEDVHDERSPLLRSTCYTSTADK